MVPFWYRTARLKTNPDMIEHVILREALPGDKDFIYDSWLKCYESNAEFPKFIPHRIYIEFHPKLLDAILKRPNTHTLVVADKEEPKLVTGYIVFEGKIIHWCYVKAAFRRFGIAKLLVQAINMDLNECSFTHRTGECNWIFKKFPNLVYNPYLT